MTYLNAVVKDAPENAIDLVEGSRCFRQVATVGNSAVLLKLDGVIQLLANYRGRVEKRLEGLMKRGIETCEPTRGQFEELPGRGKSACLLSIGDRLASTKAVQYAEDLLRRLTQSGGEESNHFLGLLPIFERLQEATWISVPHRERISQVAEEILAYRMDDGCNSEELLQA